MKPTKIQKDLLKWFKKYGRNLPWRKTHDPYAIWVSEIMLQQTQVNTVIPYYRKFLKSFPTLLHLAKADLSEVLKVWEGLGYYSRARNLHQASCIVLERFHGKLPDTLKDLLTLPGIGRSTAGAILCFAFLKKAPILDGNVKRVLSRLFAVSKNPADQKTEKRLWALSESLVPKKDSNPFNQALMDVGAMICTAKDPKCNQCPFQSYCKGSLSGNPVQYPLPTARKQIPHVTAVSAVVRNHGKVLLKRRPPHGLLGGLWEFPNWKIEEERPRLRLRKDTPSQKLKATPTNVIPAKAGIQKAPTLRLRKTIKEDLRINVKAEEFIGTFHQTFSHFKLTLQVFDCKHLNGKGNGEWVSIKKLHDFPMSRIHRKIAQTISDFRMQISD